MLSQFLNPWTFLAGAALVSVPIIIHLINRIRYRRVKWAAMEFLLKAQKRMRRRKILEQLLLLLLRCLLVFFAGLLFARYIGGCSGSKGMETRPTTHLVILDDTPSMADAWRREDGSPTDAYAEAKRLVYEKLMPATAEATTNQTMQVLKLSELDKPFPAKTDDAKVTALGISEMEGHLKPLQVTTVRKSLRDGLDAARALLGDAPATNAKVVHVISDLRSVDWAEDGDTIQGKLTELKDLGVTVHFIDVVNPARKPDRKSPQSADNVSIVEVKPRNRVVAANQQTDIEVRIKNFGGTDLKEVRVDFYLNGVKDTIPSMVFPSLPANQERVQSCQATFTQTGSRDKPLDRFNLVTAVLGTPEAGGLAIDNVRHTVVEVRPKLQVLVVDGRVDKRDKQEGDSFYLRKLFLDSFGGIDWVVTEAPKLDGYDLRPFSTVYLLNVPQLSAAAVTNLERFVTGGGGVGVFLGPDVKPEDYTARMFRGGQGFFPVPLSIKEPVVLKEEQKLAREIAFGKRVILRDPANRLHPALNAIYTNERGGTAKDSEVERYFLFTNIDSYWPIARRGSWRDDKSVQELYCMPNEKPIADFEAPAKELAKAVRAKYGDAKFEKARKYLTPLIKNIEETPAQVGLPLSILARHLDQLLCDQINDGDESEPILRDFWNQPELAEIKPLAMQLRDEAKFGDPLYVAKTFGRGRVAVMTTDAGGTHGTSKQWTDWPSGKGSPGWVVVVSEMQKYLSGGGGEGNLSLGDRYFAEFEAGRYKPSVARHLLTFDPVKSEKPAGGLIPKALGDQALDQPANAVDAAPDAPRRPFQLSYADAKVPGAYIFSLTRLKGDKDPPGTPAEQPDYAAVAFNVDATREGDMHRANTDDLATQTNKAPLHNIEDLSWIDQLKQKPTDMSSRRWLYLLILLLLIAEQAWAVRISYHSKPEDLELLAPSAAAAFAHTTAPPVPAGAPAGAA
ncbi:BatA domain-containing protein [Gemmata sp. G18]|uniref:BatA domain-containing protein n=1 Tax=Gemmata palustris TaxID=2822762 RepID=A0ABS5BN97_9BACT|nr:BatA domain-containing protein [Gemmata palustris]MBP3955140.1 BatA domain-containing protein [Gemmata palustris]